MGFSPEKAGAAKGPGRIRGLFFLIGDALAAANRGCS
jgi:hypothetical protein